MVANHHKQKRLIKAGFETLTGCKNLSDEQKIKFLRLKILKLHRLRRQ